MQKVEVKEGLELYVLNTGRWAGWMMYKMTRAVAGLDFELPHKGVYDFNMRQVTEGSSNPYWKT